MKLLKTAAVTGLVIAAVVVSAVGPAAGAGIERNVADCAKAIQGSGTPWLRRESVVAGPVRVRKRPLAAMERTKGGFVTKLPLLVEGDEAITVDVPARLRGRVFLYYGHIVGRDGKPTTLFTEARGYDETEFVPCAGKPRTAWPGGVRIIGTAPVRLLVQAGGESIPLRLGRPRALEPG